VARVEGDPAAARGSDSTKRGEARVLKHGDLTIDRRPPLRARVRRPGDPALAPKEFDLLWELLDHRGLVLNAPTSFSKARLGLHVSRATRARSDVHVRQLRRKAWATRPPIVTVWGLSANKVEPGARGHSRLSPE